MKVLVIDVGGTNVKVASSDIRVPIKIPSGPTMTAEQMAKDVLAATEGWVYDCVSIGFPGPVVHDHPLAEPHNLAAGWIDFPYQKVFGKPIRFINDAAMQALGGYKGGRMLFLGIGTGLGSAMIFDGVVVPLELAHLPYKKGRTYEEYVGLAGLERRGEIRWRKSVLDIVARLQAAMVCDSVLLGGGNAKLMQRPAQPRHPRSEQQCHRRGHQAMAGFGRPSETGHALARKGPQSLGLSHIPSGTPVSERRRVKSETIATGDNMANKYGEAALIAARMETYGKAITPAARWEQATAKLYPTSPSAQRKGGPRFAFLSLCEAGLVKGIPAGQYAPSNKNKAYALRAIALLNAGTHKTVTTLWAEVTDGEPVPHNSQMDVVLALWKNGLIVRSA